MTFRVFKRLDLQTGVVSTVNTTTTAGTVEERYAGLMAQAEEQVTDPKLILMRMLCDQCGQRVNLTEPELPEDWSSTREGDFCPYCTRLRTTLDDDRR